MGIRRYLDTSFTLGQSLSWFWTLIVLALLGAHFYRASDYGMVLCTAGMLVLRCSPLAWKRWAAGFFLLWGMLEWSSAACALAQVRMTMGAPWMRGALILSAVAVVTGLTGLAAVRQAARLDISCFMPMKLFLKVGHAICCATHLNLNIIFQYKL